MQELRLDILVFNKSSAEFFIRQQKIDHRRQQFGIGSAFTKILQFKPRKRQETQKRIRVCGKMRQRFQGQCFGC